MKPSELLAKPENWTKETIARDKDGHRTGCYSQQAHSFCLLGAIKRCNENNVEEMIRQRTALFNVIQTSITDFNDAPETTHEMVLEALRKANL